MAEKKSPAIEVFEQALKAVIIDYSNVMPRYRNHQGSGMWVSDPAEARFTGRCVKHLGTLSMELGLGTERPQNLLVAMDSEKKNLLLIPVAEPRVGSVPIRWYRGRAHINLVNVFTVLQRILPPNSREFYSIKVSDRPVEVEGKLTPALVMPLKAKKRRHAPSDEKLQPAADPVAEAMQQAAATRQKD